MRSILIVIVSVVFFSSAGLFAQDSENIEQIGRIYIQWN